MRQRHFPRLCRACRAPMARQEAACWRCGRKWVAEGEPRSTLRLVRGGAPTAAAAQAELDAGGWIDEDRHIAVAATEVARVVSVTATR